jgi:hypothetical protein
VDRGGLRYGRQRNISLDNLVNPESGIYSRMINTDVKVPVFFQMDAATRMHPPLDEITDAMLTSKHPEILSALWNIDKDANPALDKFKGLAPRDSIPSVVAVHYLFKTDDTLTALSITWRTTKVGGHFIGTTYGYTVAAQLKKNREDHGSGWRPCRVEYRARTRNLYRRDRADGRCIRGDDRTGSSRVPGQFQDVDSTPQESRIRTETEMFGDAAKRLQEDPEMKEMINAMDPVASIL